MKLFFEGAVEKPLNGALFLSYPFYFLTGFIGKSPLLLGLESWFILLFSLRFGSLVPLLIGGTDPFG